MGESPRYHDGRLWLSDWGDLQIIAVDSRGDKQVMLGGLYGLPFCFDWLPSGPWNEITIDGRGNTYVNGIEGLIALVDGNGSIREVADNLAFPNGMVVTPDNSVLSVSESHAQQLTAFDIEPDGSLSDRRVWANLSDDAPDGICLDAESAIWYADVPHRRCVRVQEGGAILQTVNLDRGCFACMLGGANGPTLFMVANEWQGMEKASEVARAHTGQVVSLLAPSPGAGWPGRTEEA